MAACEECWAKAYTIAVRTGQHQADIYRELIRQGRNHCHGLNDEQDRDEV